MSMPELKRNSFEDQKGMYHLVATASQQNRPFTIGDSKDMIIWPNESLTDITPENASKPGTLFRPEAL